MNNDLISRKALKKAIMELEKEPDYQHEGENWYCGLCMAETLIDNASPIPLPDFKEGYKQAIIDGKTNFSRPQGEWIEGENGNIKCNQCGCEIRFSYLIGNKPDFPKFCCDCGANMRKGEKE